MVNIIEPLDEKTQNEALWKILRQLAEKIQPYFKKEISIHASWNDPLEFILTSSSPHYYINAGRKKIFSVLLGFPGPMGFFGRKKTYERRILAFHDVSNDIVMNLIKNTLEEYATACRATEVVLNKF